MAEGHGGGGQDWAPEQQEVDSHGGGGQGWVPEQQEVDSHGGGHDTPGWLTTADDGDAGAGCAQGGGHEYDVG